MIQNHTPVRTQKPATPQLEGVLTVSHYEGNGPRIVRTYDFRTREGRHAFQRFSSWALANEITFHCAPTYQTQQ